MPNDEIAKLDQALARLARGRRLVEAIIERQQERLAANAEAIERALDVLKTPTKRR